MFQSFLTKIMGIILGIVTLFFPPQTVTYQTASSTTPTINSEKATSKKQSLKVVGKPITSTPVKTTAPIILEKQKPIIQQTTTKPPQLTLKEISSQFEQINTLTRNSLVNILCINNSSYAFSGISGSGIMISGDGVILTNAHVGQYLLLKDIGGQKDSVTCTIRTGSPAYPKYKAELIYIPPQWVVENNQVIVEQNPTGTGEHDYAFLKITSHTDDSDISERLPFIPINIDGTLSEGDNTLLASYPAGFLGSTSIEKNLYQTSAITQIKKIFTFYSETIDVISIPGTVISQKGSSGGAVVSIQDQLVGLITTSSKAETTKDRDLNAITLSYINRDLIKNASITLKNLLENSNSIRDTFNTTIKENLIKTLTDVVLNKQ